MAYNRLLCLDEHYVIVTLNPQTISIGIIIIYVAVAGRKTNVSPFLLGLI